MFNDEWGGQIGWLLPAALVALALGLWLRRRAGRTNPALAAVILWGGWLLTHIAVFSFMSGIAHPYYAVALGPAIGALVGLGFRDVRDLLARHARGGRDLRARRALGGLLAAATVLATAALAAVILNRTPEFAPGLAVGIVAAGAAVALVLAWPRQTAGPWRSALVGAMALAVMLAGPTAYGVETMTNSLAGGDPAAGPNASGAFGGGAGRDGAADGETAADGSNASAANIDRGLVDQDLIDYLLANRDGETWIVAIQSANQAGTIQLATGEPVMAMGGFSGSDPTPTLDELKTMGRGVRAGSGPVACRTASRATAAFRATTGGPSPAACPATGPSPAACPATTASTVTAPGCPAVRPTASPRPGTPG
jgi:4-amino-4-deoxy-L-arabinose transferase-like glycosyltransferase